MKKINVILLSMIFTAGTLNASFMQGPNPYAMLPEGKSVHDLQGWATPSRSVNVMPGRPFRASDASGTQLYYTPSGKLAVSISKDGSTTFALGDVIKTRNRDGDLTSISKTIKGTNMVEVTNEFGEVLYYKELGRGGKTVATYDKDRNLTTTYNYNKYGKGLTSIVNEMTKGMVVFDEKTGLAMYDLDFEGFRVGKYIYDDKNRLMEKIDAYGNVSYFDGNGAITHTMDKDGVIMSRYNYKYADDGGYILESVVNPRTNDITYFDETGKQTVTKNSEGAVVADYLWRGSTLVATFDRQSEQTTWYSYDGKTMYTTFNDELISKNLYYKGQLVGVWDVKTNQVTVLQNERREVVIQLGDFSTVASELTTLVRCIDELGTTTVLRLKDFQDNSNLGKVYTKIEEFNAYVLKTDDNGHNIVEYDPVIEPTAEMIKKWLDAGLIDKKYLFNAL
ncbi:MAG: hypothetical protein FWH43_04280 [Endomicrobia bacterium]|nr:hypothetical protein [Endomicrobiia bacterium]